MLPTMEVGVLGPTQVRRSARPEDAALVCSAPKQRALLAGLALHRGRPVSADTLVDLLWGERAAGGGERHAPVLRRRAAPRLEPDRAPRAPATVLVTVRDGYALQVPAEGFDAAVFEQVVSTQHARLRPDLPADELTDLVAALDDALALWRGRPYADLEDAAAAVAEAGPPRGACGWSPWRTVRSPTSPAASTRWRRPRLEALTAAHPLRERLWALRALALARSHRQAEALEVLREVRTLLADGSGSSREPSCATCRPPCSARTRPWTGSRPARPRRPPPARPRPVPRPGRCRARPQRHPGAADGRPATSSWPRWSGCSTGLRAARPASRR